MRIPSFALVLLVISVSVLFTRPTAAADGAPKSTVTSSQMQYHTQRNAIEFTHATLSLADIKVTATAIIGQRANDKLDSFSCSGELRFTDPLFTATADTLTLTPATNQAVFTGHVQLTGTMHPRNAGQPGQPVTMTADTITYNYATHRLRLAGAVTIQIGNTVMTSPREVSLDWDNGSLEGEQLSVQIKPE